MKVWLKENPIQLSFIMLLICFLFRINDIFVLRIDELWGEIIISKAFGFLLILFTLYWIKAKPSIIGLHTDYLRTNIVLGAGVTLLVYILSYGIEYILLFITEQSPTIVFAAIDPKQGISGGVIIGESYKCSHGRGVV